MKTFSSCERRLIAIVILTIFAASLTSPNSSKAQSSRVKALVGGTLIDGYGSTPLRNSVVIIQGERIKAVGQVGTLAIPSGAEVVSTEGMSVLPGLWDMHVHLMINGHSDYAHWDKTYPPQMESVIMPASARQLLMTGVTSARDLGGPLKQACRSAIVFAKARYLVQRFTCRGRLFNTSLIPALITFAGASKVRKTLALKCVLSLKPGSTLSS